jgi:hypothetical protein
MRQATPRWRCPPHGAWAHVLGEHEAHSIVSGRVDRELGRLRPACRVSGRAHACHCRIPSSSGSSSRSTEGCRAGQQDRDPREDSVRFRHGDDQRGILRPPERDRRRDHQASSDPTDPNRGPRKLRRQRISYRHRMRLSTAPELQGLLFLANAYSRPSMASGSTHRIATKARQRSSTSSRRQPRDLEDSKGHVVP